MIKLPRPCVDCQVVTRSARCVSCQRIKDRQRPTPTQRGYDSNNPFASQQFIGALEPVTKPKRVPGARGATGRKMQGRII